MSKFSGSIIDCTALHETVQPRAMARKGELFSLRRVHRVPSRRIHRHRIVGCSARLRTDALRGGNRYDHGAEKNGSRAGSSQPTGFSNLLLRRQRRGDPRPPDAPPSANRSE